MGLKDAANLPYRGKITKSGFLGIAPAVLALSRDRCRSEKHTGLNREKIFT